MFLHLASLSAESKTGTHAKVLTVLCFPPLSITFIPQTERNVQRKIVSRIKITSHNLYFSEGFAETMPAVELAGYSLNQRRLKIPQTLKSPSASLFLVLLTFLANKLFKLRMGSVPQGCAKTTE